jgi:hypothetical protein
MAVLVATAAAAFLLLLISIPGTARAGTCIGGRVCVYTGTFYTGSEENLGCGGTTVTNFETLSAQNHCGVNVRIGWSEGGTVNWKACMAPGGLRPEPGRFNEIEPNGC